MDILVRIIAFLGMSFSIGCAVFVYKNNKEIRSMHATNKLLSEYLKEESFLFMQNDGDDPCDIEKRVVMPFFSQSSEFVVRGKIK